MRFLMPQNLWALFLIPLLYGALRWEHAQRKQRFTRFADPGVWKAIAPELDWNARVRKGAIWLLALTFLILTFARPQWGTHEETVHVSGLDVMIVLDVSNSMDTEDVVPSRLKKSRHVIRSFLSRLQGDRVGVVAFAGSAFVASPLTSDLDYVNETIDVLTPRSIPTQGTDIALGLETAARALERGAEEAQEKDQGPTASRVVVLVSDGEDHEEKALDGAKKIVEGGARLYVLGVGTSKGGPIPLRDENGQLHGYKRDRAGGPIVSTFHPEALTEVAAAAKGRYWSVTDSEGEIDELLQDMGALNRSDYAERRFVVYEERYQYPLAIAVFLILLELSFPARALHEDNGRVRTAPAPGPKRKRGRGMPAPSAPGPVPVWLAVAGAAALLLGARDARAASLFKKQVPLEAYVENEKGLKAFGDSKFDDAKKKFGAAQALDPALPELQYNQGMVQMQQGDVDSAIQGFAGAAKGALENQDPALAGKSFFNLGGALTQKKDIPGAIRSYMGAIDAASLSKDAALEADARKNLQLLIQQRQQQKQKEKQDKEDKDKQKKPDEKDGQKDDKGQQAKQDSQDKKKDGKGGDKDKKEQDKEKGDQNKPGDQANDGPKQYQDNAKNRKKEFRSLKLSKEDAERVMAELSDREKQLQSKQMKQQGNPQSTKKDW